MCGKIAESLKESRNEELKRRDQLQQQLNISVGTVNFNINVPTLLNMAQSGNNGGGDDDLNDEDYVEDEEGDEDEEDFEKEPLKLPMPSRSYIKKVLKSPAKLKELRSVVEFEIKHATSQYRVTAALHKTVGLQCRRNNTWSSKMNGR